jgi:hypothetical protein
MKPFTSKHCAQYLTKESPLNQGLILANQDANDPNVKKAIVRGIRKAEEAGRIKKAPKKPINNRLAPAGYSKRTKFDNAAKKAAFIPSTELSDEAIQKMKSRKYKK